METTTASPGATGGPGSSRRWFGLPAAVRRLSGRQRPSEPLLRTAWLVIVEPEGGSVNVLAHETWREADATYERVVATAHLLLGGYAGNVRLVPYRTSLDLDALVDELLALDDFEILASSREFRP
jgi:hypothetical protein